MPAEPIWLGCDDLVAINKLEVAEAAEPHFLRDEGLLEIACQRPQNLWHYTGEEDVVTLAVALLGAIAQVHAFAQGNKRTALTAALTFILANGYAWARDDGEDLGFWVQDLVTREITEDQLVEMMRPYVVPAAALDVQL